MLYHSVLQSIALFFLLHSMTFFLKKNIYVGNVFTPCVIPLSLMYSARVNMILIIQIPLHGVCIFYSKTSVKHTTKD
jgi:hypothetical protein